jgi:hypothetical protein
VIKEKLPLRVASMAFNLCVFMIELMKTMDGLHKVWTASSFLDNVDYVDIYFLDVI